MVESEAVGAKESSKRKRDSIISLQAKGISGGYGAVQILSNITVHVDPGEMVTIIGPNGSGKSTFLKVVFGLATHYGGTVHDGDRDITRWRTDRLVREGFAYVPQVRNVFSSLSVKENLKMGGYRLSRSNTREKIAELLDMFPDLASRRNDLAASLSGGQRQMLAIARSLMSSPSFLLFDEPTAALSPLYARNIFEKIAELRAEGITVLMVEQNARMALEYSDRCYIFASGEVVHTGPAASILDDPEIGDYFLGVRHQ